MTLQSLQVNWKTQLYQIKDGKKLLSLFKLFSNIILIQHLIACVWIWNAYLNVNQQHNWMIVRNITDQDWTYQYIQSYYFATVTMTTVGYGDIAPTNRYEYVLCLLIMMISCGVFGFSINGIGNIFSQFNEKENEIKQKLSIINIQMKQNNISNSLKNEIRQYLDYVWRENNEKLTNDSNAIFSQLDERLKRDLQLESNKIIIQYLKQNFSNNFTEKAIQLIKEQYYKPQQQIFQQNQIVDQFLYYIQKGSVILTVNNPYITSKIVS
ncbi:hypothetical protein IMG5_045170 [Ichthyophthirius multifiliis]|uniref:Potassium channel domain-containing protein n=1 Tax=Ichthyophthirius multifiliis TaxID=5932 RepID=G0QM63_ICHMU|nr:hypothetical protein IMG5_045170 [Ichthyophthirius multifiliis]EGR33692.1 hypothetical protein IMG5_045170 [Ichthyophthirius multifiliis]|eukprot:XP_004037678.1 hypothetical protein IMG5_045170 [Ichthyophthirius multifiliis]